MDDSPRLLEETSFLRLFLYQIENLCFPYKIANDFLIFFVYFFIYLFIFGKHYSNKLFFFLKKKVGTSIFFPVLNFCSFSKFKLFFGKSQTWTDHCRRMWFFAKERIFQTISEKKIETREFCNSLRLRSAFQFWRCILIHLQNTVIVHELMTFKILKIFMAKLRKGCQNSYYFLSKYR